MMMGPAGKALAAGPESVTGNPAMIVSGFTASGGATVAEVRFAVGDRVDTGDLLVSLDTGDTPTQE